MYIWQLYIIFDDPPDACNAQHRNGRSPANSNQWTEIFLWSSWISSGKQSETHWKMCPGRYSSLSPSNKIPVPRASIKMFSLTMASPGVALRIYQQGFQVALSIATYIISRGRSVLCASIQRTNLEIMPLLASNTPGGIITCIERSAMPTPRQPMLNSRRAIFSEDLTCFNIFPVLWASSLCSTFSIPCRLVCLTTSRCGLSASWRRTNGSTSPTQSGYLCLHTTTSHQYISHMKKFLNEMGRRWRKWAGTWMEL